MEVSDALLTVILWAVVAALSGVLLVRLLLYALRGRRAVHLKLTGLGATLDLDATAERKDASPPTQPKGN